MRHPMSWAEGAEETRLTRIPLYRSRITDFWKISVGCAVVPRAVNALFVHSILPTVIVFCFLRGAFIERTPVRRPAVIPLDRRFM